MKPTNLICLLFTLFGAWATLNPVKANTSMGADLTYIRTGQDSVVIQYKYYRNCSASIQSPTTVLLQYQASGCHTGGTIPLVLGSVVQGYQFGCPTGNCNTGQPGVFYEEATYSAILVLPAACSNWTFSVTRPDRSADNLDSATTADMYSSAVLNNSGGIQNTSVVSPHYHPIYYACAGKPATAGGGVTDLDGDSLVFSLTDPLKAANTPHAFKPGFTAANPVGAANPFTLNPLTGVISVTAPPAIYTRYAFRYTITEYRRINGVAVMVGQTNRDMMLVIDPCPPKPPIQITNAKQSVDSVFVIAADVNTCLVFNTFQADSLSILRVATNVAMAIPG
ncbi:MAG TPA: hypothetical protein VK927_01115, partial [Adhaeribacter sp.]|nr:hypothetical protein [Adhaeribacter sp.]